jgi:hypothetical protein
MSSAMDDREIMDNSRFSTLKIVAEECEEDETMPHDDSSLNSSSDMQKEILASNETRQKVAAAKQYIENHYRVQKKNMQERKER